jgi:hypothetical protein
MQAPLWYKEFVEGNKMWALFIVYIVGTMLTANLIQTNGFEITINGQLEYSKMQTGRMPSIDEVKGLLGRYNVRI